jgi:2,3-bisphosphoglycerate-dependent phosphoglycerate mutase
MMTEIYIVRHAHSTYTPDEVGRGLSDSGKKAASHVKELLEGNHMEIFISSPYKRAVETIKGAAEASGIEILLEESFKERILGENPVEDFEETLNELWKNPDLALPGGESNRQAQRRGVEGILEVLRKYEGKGIAIGTHGNIMTLIMNYFDSNYNYEFWKKLSMPDIYKLVFQGQALQQIQRIWNL